MKLLTTWFGLVLACIVATYIFNTYSDSLQYSQRPLAYLIALSPALVTGIFLIRKAVTSLAVRLAWVYYALWLVALWGAVTDDYLPQFDQGILFFTLPWFFLNIPIAIALLVILVTSLAQKER